MWCKASWQWRTKGIRRDAQQLQKVTLSSAGMEAHDLIMFPATTPGTAMLNGPMDGFHSDSHFRGETKWS